MYTVYRNDSDAYTAEYGVVPILVLFSISRLIRAILITNRTYLPRFEILSSLETAATQIPVLRLG